MSKLSNRPPTLAARAFDDLQNAKQQILDAAAGKLPERLVLATAAAALRVAQRQAVPAEVMPERVVELARETLKGLAQHQWRPDTILLLQKHHGKGRHGISQ